MAQLSLGRMYALGEDVPRDTFQAAFWLDLAAAQGVADAETILSSIRSEETSKVAFAM